MRLRWRQGQNKTNHQRWLLKIKQPGRSIWWREGRGINVYEGTNNTGVEGILGDKKEQDKTQNDIRTWKKAGKKTRNICLLFLRSSWLHTGNGFVYNCTSGMQKYNLNTICTFAHGGFSVCSFMCGGWYQVPGYISTVLRKALALALPLKPSPVLNTVYYYYTLRDIWGEQSFICNTRFAIKRHPGWREAASSDLRRTHITASCLHAQQARYPLQHGTSNAHQGELNVSRVSLVQYKTLLQLNVVEPKPMA